MHDERGTASGGYGQNEPLKIRLRILLINANPALHRDRHVCRYGCPHRRDAIGNQLRLRHQTSAKPPLLHAVRRAADIQVDLVIAPVRADPGCLR
jgi:hypothetical protein